VNEQDTPSPTDADSVRPASVVLTAVLLILAAVGTFGLGILLSMVLTCCGSSDPNDGGAAALGLLGAVLLISAAVALLRGSSRNTVLALAGMVVGGLFVLAVARSGRLLVLALPAALAWGGLYTATDSPAWRAWLTGRRREDFGRDDRW
jgi:hypothetical protein